MKIQVVVKLGKEENAFSLHCVELLKKDIISHKCYEIPTFQHKELNDLLEGRNFFDQESEPVKKGLEDGTVIEIYKNLGVVKIGNKILNFNHRVINMWQVNVDEDKLAKLKPFTMSRLDEDFKLLEILGVGDFGIALKTRHEYDLQEYAVKKILIPNKKKEAYIKEARILAKLKHRCIVRYHTTWIQDKFIYIQMQLCKSGSLAEYLEKNKNLNPKEIRRIFKEILIGVHYIHRENIVHCDLKTENIFLDEKLMIKIGDFGIANSRKTFSRPNIRHNYNHYKDIYCLGIILLDLLHPFETIMEKMKTIEDIKKDNFPFSARVDEIFPNGNQIIGKMIQSTKHNQLSISEIFNSLKLDININKSGVTKKRQRSMAAKEQRNLSF